MIVGKKQLFALALMAATGTPYVVSLTNDKAGLVGSPGTIGVTAADRATTGESSLPLEGAPVRHLGEVFRFDVNPGWIMARWPRVSTSTPEANLRGYRVPLVTGKAEHDLAGSLTYYFDPQQQVRRIMFYGTTGDPRPLVALLTGRFQFQRKTAEDPGLHLYQVVSNGKAQCELRVRPTPVVEASRPHARYTLELWLERPGEFSMFSQAGTSASRLGL